jgi:DNA-binding transcriptional regulator LsrR (DeoR family)
MMENEITADRIVAAAEELGQAEFTRADLAAKLGVSNKDLRDAFHAARQSGRVERVGKDAEGRGVFRLAQR